MTTKPASRTTAARQDLPQGQAPTVPTRSLRRELRDRRRRLEATLEEVGEADDLVRLLAEVDGALRRVGSRKAGLCDVCGEAVQPAVLSAHPASQYCLCHLTPEQQEDLQRDLDLAWRTQASLLPPQDLSVAGWQAHYRYLPAGPVSGDILDLVARDDQGVLHFLLGDVAGKGVAASFLMARLSAMFRSLVDLDLPLRQLFERANRLFAASTPAARYATLACGTASGDGLVEICNAGHVPPLVVRAGGVEAVPSTGMPLGLFEEASFGVQRLRLGPGESLFLYSDGVSEARDSRGNEYGVVGLRELLGKRRELAPTWLAAACLAEVSSFRGDAAAHDDVTVLALQHTGA